MSRIEPFLASLSLYFGHFGPDQEWTCMGPDLPEMAQNKIKHLVLGSFDLFLAYFDSFESI